MVVDYLSNWRKYRWSNILEKAFLLLASPAAPIVQWRLVAENRVLASGELRYAHEPWRTCTAGEIEAAIPALSHPAAARLEAVMSSVGTEGRTVVMTTHDLERGLAVADRVVILARGRVVFEAQRSELDGAAFIEAYRQHTRA